jgi:hypothetical protein
MKEFNLAEELAKPMVFVIFEEISGIPKPELMKKFGQISLTMAGKMFYKYQKFDEIESVIKKLIVSL